MQHLVIFVEDCGRGSIRGGLGTACFNASVAEPPKPGIRKRTTTKAKMNASLAPYPLSTSLAQVLGDGVRCRTCGVRY
jgi:hypothetical protein